MSATPRAGSPAARRHTLTRLVLAVSMVFAAGAVCAQQQRSADVPLPQDTPYPGTIAMTITITVGISKNSSILSLVRCPALLGRRRLGLI